MRNMRTVARMAMFNLRQLFTYASTYVGLAVGLFAINLYLEPVRNCCVQYGVGVSPLQLFAHLSSKPYQNSLLFCGWIIVVCNTPLLTRLQTNVLVRAGRGKWLLGQIMSIVMAALLYWLAIIALIGLVFIGYWGEFGEWGRVIKTLGNSNSYSIASGIISNYTVVQAVALAYFLHTLAAITLAFIIFHINMVSRKMTGAAVALIFPILELAFTGLGIPEKYYYISIVTLCNLSVLDRWHVTYTPTPEYACTFLLCAVVLLGLSCYFSFRKSSFIAREHT